MRIITVVCILLLTAGIGVSLDSNSCTRIYGGESAADSNTAAKDCNGPTIVLDFDEDGVNKNPVSSFMYFIPLISPVLVERETSANNEQEAAIISCERKIDAKCFYAACEFKMWGKGFYKNTFDHAGMIARNTGELKEDEPLTNILDYIKFEGEGFGRMEVRGTINDSTETVTEVKVYFDAGEQRSPVTVGLYSISPKDGQYNYENRYNQIVARVNVLTFKKGEQPPVMGIKLASINKNEEEFDSCWSDIKGAIANLFIKPLVVDKLGNDAMLDFGYAMLKERHTFTFPKAKNIKETKTKTLAME